MVSTFRQRGRHFWSALLFVLTTAWSLPVHPAAAQGVVMEAGAMQGNPTPASTAAAAQAVAIPPPVPDPSGPVLSLTNGNFLDGDIKDSPQPGTFRWQGKGFVAPFTFPLGAIASANWPAAANAPKPTGEYCFELAGGDMLFGSLAGLDEKEAVLDVPPFGLLHVQRAQLRRILRWKNNADLIYLGPNGLTGWREVSTNKGWREEAGQIASDREGTTIVGDFAIPPRAVIEFELSWKKRLDFILAVGVDDSETSAKRAFRFEAWGGDLIVQREMDREADLAIIQEIPPGPGRIHLLAFLDQENELITIVSPSGKQLANLKFPPPSAKPSSKPRPKPAIFPGLRLTNIRGDLRLEQLRIGRWDGKPLAEVVAGKSRVHRADGSIAYGRVTRFDPAAKAFIVKAETGEKNKDNDKETKEPADAIASVFMSTLGTSDIEDNKNRPMRAIRHDGSRLGGELLKIEKGEAWLKVPGIQETPKLTLASIRSIVVLQHPETPKPTTEASKALGTLELPHTRLSGTLADAREQGESSCLAWKPVLAEAGAPLRAGLSGRIVYREVAALGTSPGNRAQQNQPQPAVISLFAKALKTKSNPKPAAPKKPMTIHLRTGDTIPCEVTKIDESGVLFKTPLSESTFIPHAKIKAVELASELTSTARVTKTKRDRLMTVPRMQKGSPPTHLIRSREGDYLRGRVLKMDDQSLEVELRLEPKPIPRDRVARIIWLHADEIEPEKGTKKDDNPGKSSGATRIQAVRHDGHRMTFFADTSTDGTISGKSEVLGACRVPVADVDMIFFGKAIEAIASKLVYQQWKLQNAPEPQEPSEDGGGSGTSGLESTLVGKPAPPFSLDLVGGGKFDLAKSKGKVVVLDFWATWCGPCMQTMPQVDRVIREAIDQKQEVDLIAVNLQETPSQITPVLDRHKLKLTVALDREGLIANKYGATAIPQTVIVGRDGNVARLFVGGGPRFEDQFRQALRAVLDGNAKKDKQAEAPKPAAK